MKCDELKPITVTDECGSYRVYNKSDVDAAISELKAENEQLKRCEIWMKQHFFCEEVIACESAKNRKLKRALWLARAEWARSSALSYHLIESHPNKDVAETYKRKANKWEKAKDKCLKKAEEYK